MATASPAPGALDSMEDLRKQIQQLNEEELLRGQQKQQLKAELLLLQQQQAVVQGATSSSGDGIDAEDREFPLQGHGAHLITSFYGDYRPAAPEFDGSQTKYCRWRKKMLCVLMMLECKTAIGPTAKPIRIGDKRISMSTLREDHSEADIESANRAWGALREAVTSSPLAKVLVDRVFAKGSPSEAWETLDELYYPKGPEMIAVWTAKYENLRMQSGEDPYTFMDRVDTIVYMLEDLGVPKCEKEVNSKIIRHLPSDYYVEQRVILHSNLSRVEILGVLYQRHAELQSNAAGHGCTPFAAGPGRGGLAGERGGRRSGRRQRRRKGSERVQAQDQGNTHGGTTTVDDCDQPWNGWHASDNSSGRGGGSGRGHRDTRRGKHAGRGRSFGHTGGIYWPTAGPYQGEYQQPHGIEPTVHPNDPRRRCHRCDQIGHTKAECRAQVILESDPNPPRGVYTRYAHGSAAEFQQPRL